MHRNCLLVLTVFAALSVAALAPGQTPAQAPAPKTAAPPGVEEKADAILRQMGKQLAAARSFTFEADESSDQVIDSGQKVQFSRRVRAGLLRPNRLAATVKGDAEDLAYTYDGKVVTIVNHGQNVHAVQEVPDTIDATFDFLATKFGITAPLSDLMFSDPYQALIEQARSGRYLGLHEVMGVKCHHLAFRQDTIDWQIWIEDGVRAVPRKVVITYKELPGYPQFVAILDKWDLDAKVADDAFRPTVPSDSKRVDLQPINPSAAATQPAGSGK